MDPVAVIACFVHAVRFLAVCDDLVSVGEKVAVSARHLFDLLFGQSE